ncbi:MAG: sulfotransferase family 2 domain-containing protein, partial [Myxococcales bacterium]|nr:sulfotransferase family 2 domain-containing protein [Myxococcales bacterium]MDD9966929.1 sulfotransferase family 2 domain-containing protein [Myxococcales bacterium]
MTVQQILSRTSSVGLGEVLRVSASAFGMGSQAEAYRSLQRARQTDVLSPWHRRERVIFVHVPKAGGSTMRQAIGDPTPQGFNHTKAWAFRRLDPELFAQAYKFAVVREPIERFYSAYSHLKKHTLAHHDPLLRHLPGLLEWDALLHGLETSRWFRATLFTSLHFQPQWYFVCDAQKRVLVDDLFAFGELGQPLATALETRLGRPIDVGHTNRSSRVVDGHRLSERALGFVRQWYATDFELYA